MTKPVDIIDYLKDHPETAYNYAKLSQINPEKIIENLIKASEDIVLCYPNLCVRYANEVVEGRWEKAEKTIAKDIYYSYHYARDILKSRFKLAEKLISQDPEYSYKYARNILKKRWVLGEDSISKNSCFSYEYAKNVLKKRFTKGEESISNSSKYSLFYACFVVEDKLPIKMHNKMIAMAIENQEDIYIKKYFDFIRGVELNITATQELLFTFDKNVQIHA